MAYPCKIRVYWEVLLPLAKYVQSPVALTGCSAVTVLLFGKNGRASYNRPILLNGFLGFTLSATPNQQTINQLIAPDMAAVNQVIHEQLHSDVALVRPSPSTSSRRRQTRTASFSLTDGQCLWLSG